MHFPEVPASNSIGKVLPVASLTVLAAEDAPAVLTEKLTIFEENLNLLFLYSLA